MRTERRCVQRKRPGGISYFELEAGSGGIVLDASEKGLGFQAADAVHQLGRSRIWISPRPEERIELTGEVVWTDTSRKTGGVRFIENGADSGKKIRTWLGHPEETEINPTSEEFPLPAWATKALGSLREEERHDASIPRPTTVPRARTEIEEQPVELHTIPGMPSLFTSNVPWQPQDSPRSDGRILYRVATGFLIVVLAVACVLLFDMFRPRVGESLIHLGEKINGSTSLRPQNPSLPASMAQTPGHPSPASAPQPDVLQNEAEPAVTQKGAPKDPTALDSSRQVHSQSSEPAIASTSGTANSVANRWPPKPAQDRSVEAARLWSAVASGNSSAEVELAQLYLRGEGVPRNCEQAKVLLRAAAKSGSFEARQQLRKLRYRGCR